MPAWKICFKLRPAGHELHIELKCVLITCLRGQKSFSIMLDAFQLWLKYEMEYCIYGVATLWSVLGPHTGQTVLKNVFLKRIYF